MKLCWRTVRCDLLQGVMPNKFFFFNKSFWVLKFLATWSKLQEQTCSIITSNGTNHIFSYRREVCKNIHLVYQLQLCHPGKFQSNPCHTVPLPRMLLLKEGLLLLLDSQLHTIHTYQSSIQIHSPQSHLDIIKHNVYFQKKH